jgi:ABC-type proline/glycine betaine transport system permease subunit
VNQLLGLVHLLFGIGHDQAVEVFFLIASVSGVRSTLALLDGTFAADGDLGAGLGLHLLQGVSTRSYE